MKTIAVDTRSLFNDESGSLKLRKAEEVWRLGAGDRVSTPHGIFQLEEASGLGYWNLIPVDTAPYTAPDLATPITAKTFSRRSSELSPRERITVARELGII
jgi:hypothetical protein